MSETNPSDGAAPPVVAPIPSPPAASSHPVPPPSQEERSRDFLRELDRRMASLIQSRLGCTIEEAEAKLKNMAAPKAPEQPPQTKAEERADEALRRELTKLQADFQKEKANWDTERKKLRRENARAEDRLREEQVRFAARQAGVRDPDIALTLYARALQASLAKTPPEPLDPAAYFDSIRQGSHAYLFQAPAAAPPAAPAKPAVAVNTAPPESSAPGGEVPPPPPPGVATQPEVEDIDNMDDQAFARRTRAKFGWSPGAV